LKAGLSFGKDDACACLLGALRELIDPSIIDIIGELKRVQASKMTVPGPQEETGYYKPGKSRPVIKYSYTPGEQAFREFDVRVASGTVCLEARRPEVSAGTR